MALSEAGVEVSGDEAGRFARTIGDCLKRAKPRVLRQYIIV